MPLRSNRAFSIVELLVSTAVIIVLAGLIIAISGPIKRKAQEGICASHMQQLWQGMMIYRMNNGGSEGFAGDHSRLGLPPEWLYGDRRLYVGTLDLWRCPAPKSRQGDYMPQYEYVPIVGSGGDTIWYMDAISRFGTRVPLIADLNHNDWASVNIWNPRVKKHILYFDLNGSFVAKDVWRPYDLRSIEFYELDVN